MFATSDRAVCREIYVEEDMSGGDDSLKVFYELAMAQGFEVEPTSQGKIKWKAPDGQQITTPARSYGRGIKNIETQLRKIGLDTSTLKPPRAKPKSGPELGMVEGAEAIPDTAVELPETSKVVSDLMHERTTAYDQAVAAFMLDTFDSLRKFSQVLELFKARNESECGHTDAEFHTMTDDLTEALRLLDEGSKQWEEEEKARLAAEERIVKLEKDVSRLGSELQEERQAHVAATERANTAEQKLNTLRSVFKDS